MGVALGSWAASSLTGGLSSDGKTLTINYVADPADPIKFGPKEIEDLAGGKDALEGVETLVFAGDFGNKDLPFIGEIVEKCAPGQDNSKKVYLDLSGCTKMKSTVNYIGSESTLDWASDDFEFWPNSAVAETIPVTATPVVHEATKFENPVKIIVTRGTEVEFVRNLVRVAPAQIPVTYVHNKAIVDPNGGTKYYFENNGTNVYVDPINKIAPDWAEGGTFSNEPDSEGHWHFYCWGNDYTIYEETVPTYTYDDENGNPCIDTDTNNLIQEADGWYYIRYVYDRNDNHNVDTNPPYDMVIDGENYYIPDGYTYTFEDENDVTHTQKTSDSPISLAYEDGNYYYIRYKINGNWTANDPGPLVQDEESLKYYLKNDNNLELKYKYFDEDGHEVVTGEINRPKQLTDNGDGTYSYVYYSFLDKDNKSKIETSPAGLFYNEDDGKWYIDFGDRYTALYVDEYIEVAGNTVIDDGNGNLTTAYYPVKFSLADDFFKHAGKLNGISFPENDNFTAIPNQVFGPNGAPSDLASATVGDNLIWIGESAFENSKLSSFDFPDGLKVIGPESFDNTKLSGCIDLENCTTLAKIAYEAFELCGDVTSIKFPAGSALTFIGNDAFSKSGLTEVDMSMCEGITEFKYQNEDNQGIYKTFYQCYALETVILPPNLTAIPDDDGGKGVFAQCTALKSVTFTGTPVYDGCTLTNPITIGAGAFSQDDNGDGRTNLESVTLSKNVSLIKSAAFQGAIFTELHIPASVGEIESKAFENCQNLTEVYFDAFDTAYGNCDGAETIIRGGASDATGQGFGAFQTCQNITDVWINTKALLNCENNAFDQMITWGAANAAANFATLHFPEENTENYANIKHPLTPEVVADPGAFHRWLWDHYNSALNPYQNGWYEFLHSGFIDDEDIEYSDIMLRTFSDWDHSYIVPNGLRAYVVSEINPAGGEDFEVTLQRIDVIPAKTGVILYGQPNGKDAKGNPDLVMTPVNYTGDPFNRDNETVKNYLEPILTEDGSDVTINPYEPYEKGATVTVRNFALGRYDKTDYFTKNKNVPTDFDLTTGNYVGFFRMKPTQYKSGYAYLRLLASEYTTADGGEIFVHPDIDDDPANGKIPYNYEIPLTSTDDDVTLSTAIDMSQEFVDVVVENKPHVTPKPDTNPKGWWNPLPIPPTPGHAAVPIPHVWDEPSKSWGSRTVAFGPKPGAKFLGEFEDDTDGIVKLIVPGNATAKGEFYTLQGVKVTNPTKGVYIQNGKKVIIK